MKTTIRECDICHREVTPEEFYRIKVRSSAFVNYCNFDTIGADKKTFDVCKDCIDKFIRFVEAERDGDTP